MFQNDHNTKNFFIKWQIGCSIPASTKKRANIGPTAIRRCHVVSLLALHSLLAGMFLHALIIVHSKESCKNTRWQWSVQTAPRRYCTFRYKEKEHVITFLAFFPFLFRFHSSCHSSALNIIKSICEKCNYFDAYKSQVRMPVSGQQHHILY